MRRAPAAEVAGEPANGPAGESDDGPDRAAPDRVTASAAPRSPTPHDLAEMGGTFAMTAAVLDPEDEAADARASAPVNPGPAEPAGGDSAGSGPEWAGDEPVGHGRAADDPYAERGLRGLVGGGSSQVSLGAALRARDAARPTDADLAAADAELVIVRRGWVPREDLPPRGPRR
jgi:hypothetical protein